MMRTPGEFVGVGLTVCRFGVRQVKGGVRQFARGYGEVAARIAGGDGPRRAPLGVPGENLRQFASSPPFPGAGTHRRPLACFGTRPPKALPSATETLLHPPVRRD